MSFRHGQWVKFAFEVPGAFKAKDGKTVGIYQKASTDALGESITEHVKPVAEDGCDVRQLFGTEVKVAVLDPSKLIIYPVISLDDIPPARLATCAPGWTPKA